jgi:hypothetical protein
MANPGLSDRFSNGRVVLDVVCAFGGPDGRSHASGAGIGLRTIRDLGADRGEVGLVSRVAMGSKDLGALRGVRLA